MSVILAWDNPDHQTAKDWVEFLPQGCELQDSVLFSGTKPLSQQAIAATQLSLSWPLNALNASNDLQNPHIWESRYARDDIARGINQRVLLSGLSKNSFVQNRHLLAKLSACADSFLPDLYKKQELLQGLASAALAFIRVINTRDMMVTFKAQPSRHMSFQQPQEYGDQAMLSLTPAGLWVANPRQIQHDDASSIAVHNLPPYRAEILSRHATHIRGGALLAFKDLSKPAPVAYISPAISEGVSVHVQFQAVTSSGPKREAPPTLLQRTRDWLRTGPC